jgi:hypothetical protein
MTRPSSVDLLVAGAVALGLAACGSESNQASSDLPPGAPVALSDAPTLVVGERSGDPDHEFFRVVTPLLLPDGGVGVPLASEGTIRIFDSEGEFVRSYGSAGEGPGEFQALWSAWMRGDAIEAHDVQLGRVTRFPPAEDVQTVLLERVGSAEIAQPGLSDGSWILHGVKEVQPDGRDVAAVHRFMADGSHVGEVHMTYGFRRHTFPMGAGPDPLSPRSLIRTEGHRVFIAETLTPRITELDVLTGDTRSIDWTPRNPLASAEALRIVRDEFPTSDIPEVQRAWTESSLDALTGSEEVSVFWDFLVDDQGFFWIRDYDPRVHAVPYGGLQSAGPGGQWIILDRDGNEVTAITVPDDFEPRSVHGDQIIGVRRDEFDVESVRVYRIERHGT